MWRSGAGLALGLAAGLGWPITWMQDSKRNERIYNFER